MTAEVSDLVGQHLDLLVGPVAHGGHCVARHEGRVVFVRHALPGERVRAVVTEGAPTAKFLRAEAIEVLEPSADRVEAPCVHARPGGCGGCDFQHVALPAQRSLKAFVIEEQLRRLARIERQVTVESVPGDDDGLRWRTRSRFTVDQEGRPGLRKHRSHVVELLGDCPISRPDVASVLEQRWPAGAEVAVAASATGDRVVLVNGMPDGRSRLSEQAAGRSWRVTGAGFWQVHPGAG